MSDLFHTPAGDLEEDARKLLLELDREIPGAAAISADCRPPIDVFETATAIEIVVDVPGMVPDSLRVILRRNTLLVVGAKLPGSPDNDARFHVAERSYGRFARAVRVAGAFDGARARAVSGQGLLRVILPMIEERRGRLIRIPVERA